MVPLYAARVSDLGPGDFVKVECTACRHEELLPADRLRIKGLPLPPYTHVLDLERRLRGMAIPSICLTSRLVALLSITQDGVTRTNTSEPRSLRP
jgi:hypothetical protein